MGRKEKRWFISVSGSTLVKVGKLAINLYRRLKICLFGLRNT